MNYSYYKLQHDFPKNGYWHLGKITDRDRKEIEHCTFFTNQDITLAPSLRLPVVGDPSDFSDVHFPLTVKVVRAGPPLDFTLNTFAVPVVTEQVLKAIQSLASEDIQSLPVQVAGLADPYFVIHTRRHLDCIDVARSHADWRSPPVNNRPTQDPHAMFKLAIDPLVAAGCHIFRVVKWEMALVISSKLKSILDQLNVTGVKYIPVSD